MDFIIPPPKNDDIINFNNKIMNNSDNKIINSDNKIINSDNKIINNNDTDLLKYNILPQQQEEEQYINKQELVTLYADITGTHTFTLNENIKDVVSVKLLSAYGSGSYTTTPWSDVFFAIIHIDQLGKNDSGYYKKSSTDIVTPAGTGADTQDDDDNNLNKLDNSFCVLENYNAMETSSSHKRNFYKNEFKDSQDIKYFDPPLADLKKLDVTIYDTVYTASASTQPFQLKLNLLVETIKKIRIY